MKPFGYQYRIARCPRLSIPTTQRVTPRDTSGQYHSHGPIPQTVFMYRQHPLKTRTDMLLFYN